MGDLYMDLNELPTWVSIDFHSTLKKKIQWVNHIEHEAINVHQY
jgi:hypothetical protein